MKITEKEMEQFKSGHTNKFKKFIGIAKVYSIAIYEIKGVIDGLMKGNKIDA